MVATLFESVAGMGIVLFESEAYRDLRPSSKVAQGGFGSADRERRCRTKGTGVGFLGRRR